MPLLTMAAAGMQTLDWGVVGLYMVLLLVTGVIFSRVEAKGTADYFLAGRRMPAWAVAVSIIASSLSVATFTGAPQQSYEGNLAYLSGNIGMLVGVVVVATLFIPVFYRANVTTIYELLEQRLGLGAKRAASAAFMVGRLFASGTRIYIAAIPLAMILFGEGGEKMIVPLVVGILALTALGVLYTLFGGIASVIWTDVIQTVVLVGAVIAVIVVLVSRIPAPVGEVVAALQTAGPGGTSKLTVVPLGLDPSQPKWGFNVSSEFTLLTALTGLALLNIASLGTDHDLTQRMLTCKSAWQGSKSVLLSLFIGVPIVCLFMLIGLLLFVYYKQPALMGAAAPGYEPPPGQRVFVTFILKELPAGMKGVMIAGLFAVGIGSLNSAINAMAATFVKDFYERWVPGREDSHYLRVGRWAVVGWGVMLALVAVACVFWQRADPGMTLLSLALGVMSFAYAGLLAVFCTALFTRRGSSASAVAALATGFVVVLLMQGPIWRAWTPMVPVWGEGLAALRIAFPWQLVAGFTLALGVCLMGKRPATTRPAA
jgi:solute:Na+ symporter, SSS family